MKQLPVSDLKSGMVTAEDILTYDSRVLVPRGVVLTDNIITRLDGYSVYRVSIEDKTADSLIRPIAFTSAVSNAAAQFSREFNRFCEYFQENFKNTLYKNEPIHEKEIMKSFTELIGIESGTGGLLISLLNTRGLTFSVYTHCTNVAVISYVLADWLKMSEDDKLLAAECGLFHDIGKIMLPPSISSGKLKRLTSREFEIAKTHTIEGFHLLGRYKGIPKSVQNAALMHHEKFDGSGYPYGLKGDEIDKFARIVAIANSLANAISVSNPHSCPCPLSAVRYFENSGLHKYELKYLLVFLENILNLFTSSPVKLSKGIDGNVIFVAHREDLPEHMPEGEGNDFSIHQQYYRSIIQLSAKKNVSIETII